MKLISKEIILAIIVGFGVGLVITYGIYTANQAIKNKQSSVSPIPTQTVNNSSTIPSTTSTIENQTDPNQIKLTLSQPDINTVTDLNTATIAGNTSPLANILVYNELTSQILIADQEGQFTTETELQKGINYITITAINDRGDQTSLKRTIVYTTTEF